MPATPIPPRGVPPTGAPAYLDHAATTPARPEVVEAVAATLSAGGNASSLHASGRAARRRVEEAREELAEALGCHPTEVVLTSGGTEADNLAVKGLFWSRRAEDLRRRRVLASAVEHHAVLDAVEWLRTHEGAEVEWLPVDRDGRLEVDALRAALARDPDTVALVAVMAANNEVGTLQPVTEVVELAHEHGVPVHVDAVQALGAVPLDAAGLGADALAVSGHKVGGPPGVGALVLARHHAPVPLLHGGGQERDVRSGTLDVAGAVGFAVAARLSVAERAGTAARVASLRDRLVAGVRSVVPDVELNGDPDPAGRLPGHAHLSFPGCEGESLLMLLDARGVECSTGSACSAGVPEPSHVLLAMGRSEPEARSSLRFTLGRTTTTADVDRAVAELGPAVERARVAGALAGARREVG